MNAPSSYQWLANKKFSFVENSWMCHHPGRRYITRWHIRYIRWHLFWFWTIQQYVWPTGSFLSVVSWSFLHFTYRYHQQKLFLENLVSENVAEVVVVLPLRLNIHTKFRFFWIWGIHCALVRKHATLALKPGADVTRISKQGYQRPTKRTDVL